MSTSKAENPQDAGWRWLLIAPAGYSILFLLFFSPILWNGGLLLSGDNGIYFHPNYCTPKTLWTDTVFGGYPLAADPTVMTWYPPAMILSQAPGSWNYFVILAFVLASTLTFCFVYQQTRCALAAWIAGCAFGMSCSLLERFTTIDYVHTVAWLPLILLGVERVRRVPDLLGTACVALPVAVCFLAGHPQTFVYSMGIVVLYCLVLAPTGEWRLDLRYLAALALAAVLAFGLIAVQFLPAQELVTQGSRQRIPFDVFTHGSMQPLELLNVVFPYLFGPYSYGPYFGFSHYPGEVASYAGLAAVLLAGVAIMDARHWSRRVAFWTAMLVLAALLSLGGHSPIATLVYRVPGYNLMRAPARHTFEIAFCLSILAAFGLERLRQVPGAIRLRTALCGAAPAVATIVLVIAILPFTASGAELEQRALKAGWKLWSLSPLSNWATAIPAATLLCGMGAIVFWMRSPGRLGQSVLVAVTMVDLWLAGYGCLWRCDPHPQASIQMDPRLEKYRARLAESGQRMFAIAGAAAPREAAPPNKSMLWNIPTIAGYGQLCPIRYQQLLGLQDTGSLAGHQPLLAGDRSLDILATRYVFVPRELISPRAIGHEGAKLLRSGIAWDQADLQFTLGASAGPNVQTEASFELANVPATRFGVVSTLAYSTDTPDGTPLVEVVFETANGVGQRFEWCAGDDSAEWSWNRRDVQKVVKHRAATVFERFPSVDESGMPFESCQFVGTRSFSEPVAVRRMTLRWIGPPNVFLSVQKISLTDDAGRVSHAVNPVPSLLANRDRWRIVEEFDHTIVFENRRALPRAWLVPTAVGVPPEQILSTLQQGRLPDGSVFDPGSIALVERECQVRAAGHTADGIGDIQITSRQPGSIELLVHCRSQSLLVLSDRFAPGWTATVDRRPAEIVPTNYVLQGIPLDAGMHRVQFVYAPASAKSGAILSCLALAAVAVCVWRSTFSRAASPRETFACLPRLQPNLT